MIKVRYIYIYIYRLVCGVMVGVSVGVSVLVFVLVFVFVFLVSMSWKCTRLEHLYTRRVYSESNRTKLFSYKRNRVVGYKV